jgi:hypothetical protein
MSERPQRQLILPAANGYASAEALMAHAFYREGLTVVLKALRHVSGSEAVDLAIKFRRSHGLPCPDCDQSYYLAGLHRAALRWPALTEEERNWSAHWLIREGYSTEVDQVFAPKPAPDKPPE